MTLALHGGPPTVTWPHPHNVLDGFTDEDRRAIAAYLDDPDSRATSDVRTPGHRAYEEELAAFHGRRHCILVNSGTSALHSAYFGLGLRPGDEVVCPTNTYFATVTAMLGVGVVPVLADAEADTGNLAADDVARRITPRTRAIVVTHQWGHVADVDALLAVAAAHDLPLVEDASLAFGATHRGRVAGSFGTVAAFSLSGGKLFGGGHGGALMTDDDTVAERAVLLGHAGPRSESDVTSRFYGRFAGTGYGHNFRMHPAAVAMSRARFERRDELLAARHDRLGLLSSLLTGQDVVEAPVTRPDVWRGQWGGYVATFRADHADGVSLETFARALVAEGVECSPGGYHPLLHRTPFFRTNDDGHVVDTPLYADGDLPVAEAYADRSIGFPTFLHEPDELIRAYADAVQKVVSELPALRAR